MSERSTYVTDLCTLEMAQQVAAHISKNVETATIVDVSAGRYLVAGMIRASWPGGEWECLNGLDPLPGGPRLVINCECTKPILWDLATGTWAEGILAT